MNAKFKKILFATFAVLNIFSLALPVHGMDTFALGNPTGAMNSILSDLGVDKNQLKNNIKTANVASLKISPPMVSLAFDPTDPVPGEKVTVTAIPTYFMNTTENLYFTWYMKSKRCYDRVLDGDDYKSKFAPGDFAKCDLNNTGEVDIEDYKIKAMRLLVNNDFVWESADYSSDSDNDGYEAVFGGDDQRGKNPHCFIQDVASGGNYEIGCEKHLFPNSNGDTTGDGSFGASEEYFWHTNSQNADTASTGNTDEANVAGLGENVFTFPYTAGDKIGVAVEGIGVQATQESDSSYRTMWAFTNNKCEADASTSNAGYPKTETTTTTEADTPSADYTTTTTTTTTQSIVDGSQINDSASIRTTTTITIVVSYIDPVTGLPDPGIPDTTTTTTTTTCPVSSFEGDGTVGCSGYDEFKQITMTDIDTSDLNSCLYQNLITPTEGGGVTEKLDVNLDYLPENPINDASGNENGDLLSFTASVTNATNPAYLNYTWEVFASNESNPDSWGTALSKASLDDATQTSGLGIDTFSFNLNFSSPQKYLKIKVTAKDTLVEDGEREGHTDVVVPIFSSEERIKVYTAKTTYDPDSSNPQPSISLSSDSPERCLFTDPESGITRPQSVCSVVEDEIIALEIENDGSAYGDFLWTIDGAPNTCADTYFSGCLDSVGKATTRTYFPILKNSGDQYTANISALNTSTGERISLTRVFEVITPEVEIVPKEKDSSGSYICRGILLGNYVDFDNQSYEDRSDQSFQALTGKNIELYPAFSGIDTSKVFASASDCLYKWTVNGDTITAGNATDYGYSVDLSDYGKLILPPKEAEEIYSVSLSAAYTPTNATKKTLNKYWNITYNEFYEKRLTDDITIEMVSTGIAQKDQSSGKIFATVSSGLPEYIAFLFRIALSGLAIVLSLKVIFFILPKSQSD